MNTRFQNARNHQVQDVPPIWFMRQAGRYHSHYQALRKKHGFAELCKVPELAAEVALGPVQDFDFDVAILFSDLLFILEGLGMPLSYDEGGPRLGFQLRQSELDKLNPPDVAAQFLKFQGKALQLTRARLAPEKSLIGFVGGPFTLFSYAVEGRHDKRLISAKKHLGLFPRFLEVLLPVLVANIENQLAHGAEVVMLFDTAAGELSPELFRELCVHPVASLVKQFPGKLGYHARNASHALICELDGALAGVGVDHREPLAQTLALRGRGFVQGNFDEALLHLEPSDFRKCLRSYLEPLRNLSPEARAGWVCGLGHGVTPQTPEENVRTFVQTVRSTFGGM